MKSFTDYSGTMENWNKKVNEHSIKYKYGHYFKSLDNNEIKTICPCPKDASYDTDSMIWAYYDESNEILWSDIDSIQYLGTKSKIAKILFEK